MRKIVFITGISAGFGYEISKILAENNYRVYGTIRSQCDVPEGVIPVKLDLTNKQSIDDAVAFVADKEGKIDVLINNAGMHTGGAIEDFNEDLFQQHLHANLTGWIQLTQAALPLLRQSESGLIINISSIGGLIGLPFQGIHSVTKFGIEGLSQTLRFELKQFGIKVVVINPGDAKTKNTSTRFKCISENSPYYEQFVTTMNIVEHDETNGMHPSILAKKVLHIIQKKKPKYRYVVASPLQQLSCLLKKVLPERLFYYMLGKYYKC